MVMVAKDPSTSACRPSTAPIAATDVGRGRRSRSRRAVELAPPKRHLKRTAACLDLNRITMFWPGFLPFISINSKNVLIPVPAVGVGVLPEHSLISHERHHLVLDTLKRVFRYLEVELAEVPIPEQVLDEEGTCFRPRSGSDGLGSHHEPDKGDAIPKICGVADDVPDTRRIAVRPGNELAQDVAV